MSYLFAILFLASIGGLIIGLIKPSAYSRLLKNSSRKKVAAVFTFLIIASFVLTGITSDSTQVNSIAKNTPQESMSPTEVVNIATQPTKVVEVTYQILQRWSIPNGGEGKLVLISPKFLMKQT